MSFRRRSYTEVLNNLLAGILGGVTAESHPFPPPGATEPPYAHALEKPPVTDVVSIHGVRNGRSFEFIKETHYILDADKKTLKWQEGAQLPDAGTVFHVNYLSESAVTPVNDIHVGSVVRTLAESIGLEIARLYAQLEGVYESGFIDTASGRALDNVVALLGIQRVKAGRFSSEVEFTRALGSHGAIFIPAGTRVMTADGNVEYETTTSVTLVEGQNTVHVVARDVEANTTGLEADTLIVLAKPIAGIVSVTNPAPTKAADTDESDAELRSRAKNFLHGSERATLGALSEAVTRQGVLADVQEVADEKGRQVGRILITPHVESLAPELRQRMDAAIQDARPAGVYVKLATEISAPKKVNLKLRITTSGDLLEQDLRAAQEAARQNIIDYFGRLPVKEPVSLNRIIGLVLSVAEIQDVQILNAYLADQPPDSELPDLAGETTQLGDLEIIDPNLPTLLRVVITYPADQNPPNKPQIEAILNLLLTTLNNLNAAESVADESIRSLSYGKLLYGVQLVLSGESAAKSAEEIESEISDLVSGAITDLPEATDVAPYVCQFVFTMESGLSVILDQTSATGDAYDLTPFERLTLAAIEIKEEPANG
jgi:hypothetical protein